MLMTLLNRAFVGSCVVFMAIGASVSVSAQEAQRPHETRRHFELVDKKGALYYQGTALNESSQTLSRSRVLIRDLTYGDFIVSWTRSFTDQVTVLAVTDKEGKSFVRLTFKWPFTSKTRDETLAEAQLHPELQNAPTIATLETNGGKWQAVETEWQGTARLHELRTQVRRSMDFTLLEGIERMRSMALGTPDIDPIAKMITTYVVHGAEGEVMVSLVDTTVAPDCDFDKSFGLPCSERQLERLKKAREQQRQLENY